MRFFFPKLVDELHGIRILVEAQLEIGRRSNSEETCDVNRNEKVETVAEFDGANFQRHRAFNFVIAKLIIRMGMMEPSTDQFSYSWRSP